MQTQSKTKKRNITPKEKLTRKRTRNEGGWIDVKAKTNLNIGIEHLNRSGKLIAAKKMGPPCNLSCRLKCVDKVSDEIRKILFADYWALGDHSRQWDLIARYVKVSNKQVGSVNSRRQCSRKYFLPIPNNNTEIQVCKTMFLRTFSISEKVVQTVSLKLTNSPALMADRRGKHTSRPARISDEVKECINGHISSFTLVGSHYTRAVAPIT